MCSIMWEDISANMMNQMYCRQSALVISPKGDALLATYQEEYQEYAHFFTALHHFNVYLI